MLEEIEMSFQPLWDKEDSDADLLATIPKSSRRQRVWLTALAIVLLAAWGGGVCYWQLASRPTAQFMQAVAHIGDLSVKISATGAIAARAQYNMNFLSPGRVREINVQIGQHVEQGQVLAKLNIDKTALLNTTNVAQTAANMAQATLDAARINLDQAETNLGKVQTASGVTVNIAHKQALNDITACRNSGTSLHSCQQTAQDKYTLAQQQASATNFLAQNQVNSAMNQVKSAQSNLNLTLVQFNAAQRNLDDANANAILVAPVSATVASISGIVGQDVEANSDTASHPFMILADISHVSIAALVNEADIGNVQVGQSAQFTVSSYPSNVLTARVSAIEMVGQTTSNVVNYLVHLTVDQNTLNGVHLLPGMTAVVNIITAQRKDVLLIPSSALDFTSSAIQAGKVDSTAVNSLLSQTQDSIQDQRRVVLVLRNSRLTPIVITTGQGNEDFTEVISGLRAGDGVVVDQVGGSNTASLLPW